MFVGFVDGDGYIKITKSINRINKDYLSVELVVSLNIRDKETLYYIKDILKVGRIYIYKSTIKYIISRVDLQEVIFPLLIYHNMYFLTKNRHTQYIKCIQLFKKKYY